MNNRANITRISLFAVAVFFVLSANLSVLAQIIAFDTGGLVGNEATFDSTTTNTNLNVSTLSRGAGISASSNADSFNSNNFNSTSIADAITTNEFLQFTVSPKNGFKVSLSTLDANFRRSATGPNTFQYQYSLDGFATAGVNIGSSFTYTGTQTSGLAQPQIVLSTIAALQNVSSPTVITIRLYAAGATGTTGAFGIGELAGNDLAIGGTVEAVTTAAPVGVGGRVLYPGINRGVFRALVTLTDNGGNVRTAYTNPFGYYRFDEVPAGIDYIFTVSHIRYQFAQPTQIHFIGEENNAINFFVLTEGGKGKK